jgi:hypothetical protein
MQSKPLTGNTIFRMANHQKEQNGQSFSLFSGKDAEREGGKYKENKK